MKKALRNFAQSAMIMGAGLLAPVFVSAEEGNAEVRDNPALSYAADMAGDRDGFLSPMEEQYLGYVLKEKKDGFYVVTGYPFDPKRCHGSRLMGVFDSPEEIEKKWEGFGPLRFGLLKFNNDGRILEARSFRGYFFRGDSWRREPIPKIDYAEFMNARFLSK